MTTVDTSSDTELPDDHRRIDLDDWNDVYVIGDVHGCLEALERLLSILELGANDLGIFVGDLVQKGPESEGVLDRVRSSPSLTSVRGNNEQKLLDGDASLESLSRTQQRYLESLPVAVSWDGGLVVHGGVDPNRPVAEHDDEDLLTMRAPDGDGYDGPFWFEEYCGPPRVFFGHTVLEAPLEREWVVGLDTGCVYGGRLSAYHVKRETVVGVPTREHVERSPEKVVAVDDREGVRER